MGFACTGYVSISRGTVQRGPSFHSCSHSHWHRSLHGLPLVCMKREMHPPFSLHLENVFSFWLGPTVLVQKQRITLCSLSLLQIEETMPRWINTPITRQRGEEDRRQRERQGLTGTLMALYKQVEESVPSQTHFSLCLSLHPAAPPLLSMIETDQVKPQKNSEERRWRWEKKWMRADKAGHYHSRG